MAGSRSSPKHSRPPRKAAPAGSSRPPRKAAPAGSALGGEQVEGVRAVAELLRAGRRKVREIWVARGYTGDEATDDEQAELSRPDPVGEIARAADAARVPLRTVDRVALHHAAITDTPQGVIAWAEPLEEIPMETICQEARGRPPFLVVLEGVTDPRNVGAIARTALTAGATGMVLPRHRGAHITPAAAKAAAGAVEYLAMAVEPGIPAALTRLVEREVWCVGLDPDAGTSIYEVEVWEGPVAVVLGAEGRGLSRLSARRCDLLATIPQAGPLGSLNVSAAAAVVCFEVARRRAAMAG